MTHLSPREEQILHLIAQHYTYAEIITTLGIRYGTLSGHMQSIADKTGVRTQIKLAGYAIDQGYGKKEEL